MNETEPKPADLLAIDRTRMAADRTLMGWIRTALSMITFGFTLFKFLQYLQKELGTTPLHPQGPRILGLALIGIGTFSLIIGCIQQWKYIKRLMPDHHYKPWNLAFIVAFMMAILGVLMFGSIILRTGPFD